jgi:hypothetical protein
LTENGKFDLDKQFQAVEQEMADKAAESDQLDSQNPGTIDSRLNEGRRIDYALQEAPLESFNEYLFALVNISIPRNGITVKST